MKKKILKSLLVVLIVASIGVGVFFIFKACGFTSADDFIRLRDNLGDSIYFWLIIALLQGIQVTLIPVSNQLITVPLALIFPTSDLWKVWLCSWLSIWFATLILYVIGRFGGEKILNWILGDKEQTEKCGQFLKKGKAFYIIGMLSLLPDDIITILAGVGKMGFVYVAVASLFTRAIDVACSVFGFGLLTNYWWGWILLIFGIIAIVSVSIIVFQRTKREEQC